MLTVKQASARLGISPSLVYALCHAKRIRYERHGIGRGRIRIPEDALEEYRRRQTVEADAPAVPAVRLKLRHLKL